MLKQEILDIIEKSKRYGWVLEPDAKKILALSGINVPRWVLAGSCAEALAFAGERGFPLAAKVVSPRIMHKSDAKGVVVGIKTEDALCAVFKEFSRMDGFVGMHLEEMVSGRELIVGAKVDQQFGPVILFGMGGTGVELYRDTTIRMAPLAENDIISMIKSIIAYPLLEGYRGDKPVDMADLTKTLIAFSGLVMEIHPLIDSVDLNPLFCSSERCVVGDARIVLKKTE